MKKLLGLASFAVLVAAAPVSSGAVNAPVHIAYPISGSTNTNYFTVSFSATCPGGENKIAWTFDGNLIGRATFYDNFNTQFLHKLPSGWHVLRVDASCGSEALRFYVH